MFTNLRLALIVCMICSVVGWILWDGLHEARGYLPISDFPAAQSHERTPLADAAAPPVRAVARGATAGNRTSDLPKLGSGISFLVTKRGSTEPIPAVPIRVAGEGVSLLAELETNDEGRAVATLPANEALYLMFGGLSADQEYGTITLSLDGLKHGEVRDVHVEMPFGFDGVFWGQVFDEETGAVIPGASISKEDSTGRGSNEEVDSSLAISDADGIVSFPVQSWRRGALMVQANGYTRRCFKPSSGFDRRTRPFPLYLRKVAAIEVATDGASPVGIRLRTDGYHIGCWDSDPEWYATVQELGATTVSGLPAGVPLSAEVRLIDGGWHQIPGDLLLQPGEHRKIKWELRVGSIAGTLIDQFERPFAGATLWLVGEEVDWGTGDKVFLHHKRQGPLAEVITDEHGSFRFEDIPLGDWWIGPRPWSNLDLAPAESGAPLGSRLQLGAEQLHKDIVIQTWRDIFIRGRLLTPDGGVPRYGSVRAFCDDPVGHFYAALEPSGEFRIGPVAPGPYTLIGKGDSWADSTPSSIRAPVDGLVLVLQQAGAVRGRIVWGASGEAAPADVCIGALDGQERSFVFGSTKGDGSFEFDSLVAGDYCVTASTESGFAGSSPSLGIAAGEDMDGVIVELEPAATLRVLYDGPDLFGQVTLLKNGFRIAADGIHKGASQTFVVPPGRIEVRLRIRPDVEKSQVVITHPGSLEQVAFDID